MRVSDDIEPFQSWIGVRLDLDFIPVRLDFIPRAIDFEGKTSSKEFPAKYTVSR